MNNKEKRLKDKSATYFDKIARDRQIIKEPQLCYPIVMEALKGHMGKILDIGCGEGILLNMIKEEYADSFQLYGLDISRNALENARETLGDHAVLEQGDSENLPFEDDMFDIIVCTHSFHHYPRPMEAVREMYRCLKKGGIVCIVDNYRPEIPRRIRNIAYVLLNHPKGDIKFYSIKEMGELLNGNGFENITDELITKKSFKIIGEK